MPGSIPKGSVGMSEDLPVSMSAVEFRAALSQFYDLGVQAGKSEAYYECSKLIYTAAKDRGIETETLNTMATSLHALRWPQEVEA
jgi:hypothetical protein